MQMEVVLKDFVVPDDLPGVQPVFIMFPEKDLVQFVGVELVARDQRLSELKQPIH